LPEVICTADISERTMALLKQGAEHALGTICPPGQVEQNYKFLKEAEDRGYLRFLNICEPIITPAGRAAIGAPTEQQADLARHNALLARLAVRKRLKPDRRADPRTEFDYRSYKAMNYVCVLAVRAPDDRVNPRSVKIMTLWSDHPEGFGPGNSIIEPECAGTKFVLACIPAWLQRRLKLPMGALPLPDQDTQWTAEDRETWDRLRQLCHCINSRIRNANRRKFQNLRYGETA
jgi:hypothetical protein